MSPKAKIIFEVAYLYYLPHFMPVIKALKEQFAINCQLVFLTSPPEAIIAELKTLSAEIEVIVEDELLSFYRKTKSDWVIFGHAAAHAAQLNDFCKTALILHGLGPKSTYYNASSADIEYRFVESKLRQKRLQELYPDKKFIVTGYTKLDPIVGGEEKGFDLKQLGLDPDKKTLLYSPTFYPSTIENFPRDWPQQFNDYNILIKPHYLSLIKSAYKKQRELLEHWSRFDNVYLASLEQQSLLPFMKTADLMISETSSALFEFMALDKPVIVCHFLKLRWGYRGFLKFRMNKRLSDDYQLFQTIGSNINDFSELKKVVSDNLSNPEIYQPKRQEITQEVVGELDGLCSTRVANFLVENSQCES